MTGGGCCMHFHYLTFFQELVQREYKKKHVAQVDVISSLFRILPCIIVSLSAITIIVQCNVEQAR